jgi:hypothetical protein
VADAAGQDTVGLLVALVNLAAALSGLKSGLGRRGGSRTEEARLVHSLVPIYFAFC